MWTDQTADYRSADKPQAHHPYSDDTLREGPRRDKIAKKVRAIPMAAMDSEGERHAWEELVRVKELEREALHDKCLQHEKVIREQVVLLRHLQTSESRLKNFKKTFGSRMEKDKQKIRQLEEVITGLNRMVNDPNPALKGIHEVLQASEAAHEESKKLAEKSVEVAKVAAQIPVERPPTPPSLKELVFKFQNTGRKVGIVWGKRERHGVMEVVVERVEENGQALRHGVPEGFVLTRVRHSRGEPDITKLKFSAIVNVLEAGLQYSPLEVTLSEPAAEETLAAQNEFLQASKKQAEAEAEAAQKQSKVIVPKPIVPVKTTAPADAAKTRGVPKLPSIAGPHGRQNILRQLAHAANEQAKLEPSSDEEPEGEDMEEQHQSEKGKRKGKSNNGSRPSTGSGVRSRPGSGVRSRPGSAQLQLEAGLDPEPEQVEAQNAAGNSNAETTVALPETQKELAGAPEDSKSGKALAKVSPSGGNGRDKATKKGNKKKSKSKQSALVVSSGPSVEDNQYAITALSKSEAARQREAKRNVELQQRLEKMSIDLVVNAELVSSLQEELVRAETLAAQELHTVAEQQRRQEAVTKRNAVAAGMLRTVCELSDKLIQDLQTLNRDQLHAADMLSAHASQQQEQQQEVKLKEKGATAAAGSPRAIHGNVTVPVGLAMSVSQQEIADYAVIKLGMDATSLQDMEWLAKAALTVAVADGWQVSRQKAEQASGSGAAAKRINRGKGAKSSAGRTPAAKRKEDNDAPIVYLNKKDGRVMEKHPMEHKCHQIHLNLLRWAGVKKQAMAVVETPATALVAVPDVDGDEGEEEEEEEEEETSPGDP
eukprot:COSAG02_NODE_3292_length_6997_cov_6.094955_1_plen_824_part_00